MQVTRKKEGKNVMGERRKGWKHLLLVMGITELELSGIGKGLARPAREVGIFMFREKGESHLRGRKAKIWKDSFYHLNLNRKESSGKKPGDKYEGEHLEKRKSQRGANRHKKTCILNLSREPRGQWASGHLEKKSNARRGEKGRTSTNGNYNRISDNRAIKRRGSFHLIRNLGTSRGEETEVIGRK